MRITKLSPQRRNSRRVSVFLDGKYSFSLDEKTVAALGLVVGTEVDARQLDRALHEDELQRAKDYALLLLSYRARTEHELRKRLVRKRFRPGVATEAVARLKELRLVDDGKFAQDYVRERMTLGQRGARMVRLELTRLGVSRQDIDRALGEAPDELEAAREVVRRLSTRYRELEPAVRKRRLYAALGRRGFAPDTVRAALETVEDEPG